MTSSASALDAGLSLDLARAFVDSIATIRSFITKVAMKTQDVGFVLLPQFSMLTLSSASVPLRLANKHADREIYRRRFISLDGNPALSAEQFLVAPDCSLTASPDLAVVFVVGSLETAEFFDAALANWLRNRAHDGCRIAFLGSSTMLGARAGLLDGRRVAVHWQLFDTFAERFSHVHASRDLFCMDGERLSCAGGTSAIDLVLTLIAVDHGLDIANDVAEEVLYPRIRLADEAQRSSVNSRYGSTDERLARAVTIMQEKLEYPPSIQEIAASVGLSMRQFERLFRHQLDTSPYRFYVELRLKQAQSLLCSTSKDITKIALECGFVDASHFIRSYSALFGETPGDTRRTRAQRSLASRRSWPPYAV